METKTTSKKGQLIRKLHVLRGAAGMTQEEYEALLGNYGVERLKSLTYAFQKRKRDMDGLLDAIKGEL